MKPNWKSEKDCAKKEITTIKINLASSKKHECPFKNKPNLAEDATIIQNQRSRFSEILDNYINGLITRDAFILEISPLISDNFSQALIRTPLGNSGPFIGKQAFIDWLSSLPETTFAGFADHRLVNLQFNQLSEVCDPNHISQKNKAPNLLRIKAGPFSLLVWEVSDEEALWVRVRLPECNCIKPHSTWLMESYLVNSTHLFDMTAVDIDFYNLGLNTSTDNKINPHLYKIPQNASKITELLKKRQSA